MAGEVAAAAVIRRLAEGFEPRLGIVLGSGLADVAGTLQAVAEIAYADIPGFPKPSVPGHDGRLVLGTLGGLPVACLLGRVHAYEGRGYGAMATPVRTLARLGCRAVHLTAAAGSLHPEWSPGMLMAVRDHLNLMGGNPLIDQPDAHGADRFVDMTAAYDTELMARQHRAASQAGLPLAEGVYAALLGPSFETPAEVRMLARLGADAVGMSVVPEAIVARQAGLAVTATVAITNLGAGLATSPPSHQETLQVAGTCARAFRTLLTAFCEDLAGSEIFGT